MQLAFYHGRGTWLDRLIRLWLRGRFSHVELVLDDGTCWSSSPRDGGVRAAHIDLDPARWTLVPVAGDEARALALFTRHDGARYDWLGVFGFVLRPLGGDGGRWFCSEICAAALGWPDPWRFCPNTLAAVVTRPLKRAKP
jgi:hypothetical protein